MKSVEERLKSYEPLWENWTYTGNFLGQGAMSSVFEIQSNSMGLEEVAALKIITVKKDFRGEVKIPNNALNEIKILQTLSGCPNIVSYHDNTQRDIYDENNELCAIDILIKMEKLKALREGQKFTDEQVISLAKDMCNALIHASNHGIVHRDIKPQNIFVDEDGTYKLGDFGISKIVSRLSNHFTANVGTLAYVPPEATGSASGTYDISSDIYSLGLVLYVFLNDGYLPFSQKYTIDEAISKRLVGDNFQPPSHGSKALKNLVMRACSFDRVKRYKTPQEMLDALEMLSSGGKKLVADPFATLDANEGYSDSATVCVESHKTDKIASDFSDVSSTSKSATGSGLRINMKTSPKLSDSSSDSSSDSVTSTESGLRMNLKTSSKSFCSSSDSSSASVTSTESGLRMNLKTSSKSSGSSSDSSSASVTSTGSGLRINMRTSSSSSSVPKTESKSPVFPASEVKENEARHSDEKKTANSFFSAPDSL